MKSKRFIERNKRGNERHVFYQLEPIKCSSPGCQCSRARRPIPHGPYWYAYWNQPTGARKKRYVGVKLRRLTFEQLRAYERSDQRKAARRRATRKELA